MQRTSDLLKWARRERDEAARQLDLFGSKGVKAVLYMPDGTTMDITEGVVRHQTQNLRMFGELISTLEIKSGAETHPSGS